MADLIIPDISEFQGLIDWNNFSAPVAIVRLCYGDLHVDAQADRNTVGARSACKVRGWYCYLIAGRDPVAQADTFCRVLIAHGGLQPNEFIVCDDEESAGGNEVDRVNAFLDRCDASLSSKYDWWYSGLNFSIAHNLQAARGRRWIAAYGVSEPAISHDMWQYTSSGQISGINGKVDLSVFHGSVDDFVALIGGTTYPKISGGNMAILPAPFFPSRLDVLVVGTDGALYHTFSDGGVGGLDHITSWDNYGRLPGDMSIQIGTVDVCWDSLNRLCIIAADADHNVYLKCVRSADGGIDQDWTRLNAVVGVPADQMPAGVPGPAGPTYDDTQVKTDIQKLQTVLSNVKAALE